MRIALDVSAAARRERTGIARYATCLLDALIESGREHEFLLGVRLSRLKRARWRYRNPAGNVAARLFVDASVPISFRGADVFHGLDGRIPRRTSLPCVATVHDVGPLERAEIASAGFRERKLRHYALLAERAARIVCVSAAARDAFRRHFDLPPGRFAVIHHGIEPRFFAAPGEAETNAARAAVGLAPEQPYFLFIGLISARKNLETLVEAFAGAEAPHALVLAGGRAHGADGVDAAIARHRLENRVLRPGFVADAHLPALYRGATALLFPGLAEGFGIPMLEAMAAGCPVLAHASPVSTEVTSGAALLADCSDASALANAVGRLASDGALRDDLGRRGRLRANDFTWDAAARATLQVYRSVIDGRSG